MFFDARVCLFELFAASNQQYRLEAISPFLPPNEEPKVLGEGAESQIIIVS